MHCQEILMRSHFVVGVVEVARVDMAAQEQLSTEELYRCYEVLERAKGDAASEVCTHGKVKVLQSVLFGGFIPRSVVAHSRCDLHSSWPRAEGDPVLAGDCPVASLHSSYRNSPPAQPFPPGLSLLWLSMAQSPALDTACGMH